MAAGRFQDHPQQGSVLKGVENTTLKAPTNSPQEHPKKPEVAPKGSQRQPKRSKMAAGRFQDHAQQGSILKGDENTTLKAPAPKSTQRGPKWFPRSPKESLKGPQRPPGGSKTTPSRVAF